MADKDPKTKKKLNNHRVAGKTAAATQKVDTHKRVVATSQQRDLILDEHGIPVAPEAISRNKRPTRQRTQRAPDTYKAIKLPGTIRKAAEVVLTAEQKTPSAFTPPQDAGPVVKKVLSRLAEGKKIPNGLRNLLTSRDREIIGSARNAGQVKETGIVISRKDLKKIREFQRPAKKLG